MITKIIAAPFVDFITPANFTSCLGYYFLVKVGRKSQHLTGLPSLKLTDCPHERRRRVPALQRRRSRFRTWHCAAEWHCSQNSHPIKSHYGIWTLQHTGQMTQMKSTMHVEWNLKLEWSGNHFLSRDHIIFHATSFCNSVPA